MVSKIMLGVALLGLAVVIAVNVPDVMRYIRISRM
jgi:hypothetical protein